MFERIIYHWKNHVCRKISMWYQFKVEKKHFRSILLTLTKPTYIIIRNKKMQLFFSTKNENAKKGQCMIAVIFFWKISGILINFLINLFRRPKLLSCNHISDSFPIDKLKASTNMCESVSQPKLQNNTSWRSWVLVIWNEHHVKQAI